MEILKKLENTKYNNKLYNQTIEHIKRNELFALSKNLKKWLLKNNLKESIKKELDVRKSNFKLVLESNFSKNWPRWMRCQNTKDDIPNAIPLYRNARNRVLNEKCFMINKYFNLESKIYHFNWSGNPFLPKYEKCLMVPIHGMVSNLDNNFNNNTYIVKILKLYHI